jgi:3-methylcrotonyl-CoA carboxylase alpha subunit
MIASLLIANRGEIACRIIRTARRMGIRTVVVYSDADANALHVRSADEAVHIGPSPARESYLVGEKIIAAAQQTGAQAIHPGYGFLSENADFAQAVIDAGLIWVGATPHSIRAMGLKDAAKSLMQAAGVPVTPGYLGEDQSPDHLKSEADAIGYPVLIKAVAGGGGKGMRRVDAPADFLDALASCQREAASSFGDDRVILEKYILSPRHIEVQVFGDTQGNIVHLFERDCSLQRRHQKVIEEAPAPGMTDFTRAYVCAAAVRAAQAVDYVGAGTIEFIADGSSHLHPDRIWFMEMNTRLQVEHPVTEAITGVDLVEWQLRVASGEPLPLKQQQLSINGHAIEARLYAEDPARNFLPSTGRLDYLALPSFVRIETSVEEGDAITPFYDPMIAKLIAHGADREEARMQLAEACGQSLCAPVITNAWFLKRLLDHPDFALARLSTDFIPKDEAALTASPEPSDMLLQEAAERLVLDGWGGSSEWQHGSLDRARGFIGFRLNAPPDLAVNIYRDNRPVQGLSFDLALYESARSYEVSDGAMLDGRTATFFQDGAAFTFTRFAEVGRDTLLGDGAILAPMPGRIIAVDVVTGQSVTKDQKLVTLEAMKMEHSLTAPFDGTVAELNATTGAQVQVETLLARIEPNTSP